MIDLIVNPQVPFLSHYVQPTLLFPAVFWLLDIISLVLDYFKEKRISCNLVCCRDLGQARDALDRVVLWPSERAPFARRHDLPPLISSMPSRIVASPVRDSFLSKDTSLRPRRRGRGTKDWGNARREGMGRISSSLKVRRRRLGSRASIVI